MIKTLPREPVPHSNILPGLPLVRCVFAAFIATVAFVPFAIGQESLTLEQCISRALADNLQIRNAQAVLKAGTFEEQRAFASGRPQVSAVGNVSVAPHSTRFGYDPAITDGGQLAAQIAVKQTLYTKQSRMLQFQRVDIDKRQRELQLQNARQNIILSVKQLFAETVRAQAEVTLREASVKQLSDYLALVQLYYNSGNAGYGDILKTRLQLSSANEALGISRSSVELSKIPLAQFIGMSAGASFQLSGDLDSMAFTHDTTHHILDTNSVADIALARSDMEKGLLDLGTIRQERYSGIAIVLDGGYLASMDRLVSSDGKTAFGLSVGANVEFPLFDNGLLQNRLALQQLIIDTLRTAVQAVKQSVETEYAGTLVRLKNARATLESVLSRIKDAQQDYLLSKSKYAAGAVTCAELLLAQQAYTDIQLEALQIKTSVVTLSAELERFTAHK